MIPRRRALTLGLTTAALATCVALAAGGCGSTYRPDASAAPDGSPDAESTPDAGPAESGQDASTCAADLQKDPKNCGRCGHDCLAGPCSAGKCGAFELSSVSSAPLRRILSYGSSLFVSARVLTSNDAGGIWRIPKAGGAAEALVTLRYAEGMALLGDTLFFVVDDDAASAMGTYGGLYSCPAMAAAPCAPTLIAAAARPAAVAIDGGRVFYTDATAGKGLMMYAPPDAPTIYRAGDGALPVTDNLYVDGASVFFTTTGFVFPQHGSLVEELPDGGDNTTVFTYAAANATSGRIVGTPTALFFSAYDLKTTTGGVVHRTPRNSNGGQDCDFGGNGNARPFGIHLDDTHVYWVNQGVGALPPYTGSTVVSCPQTGCCTTPDVLWTGEGQLAAITGDGDALYFAGTESGSVWKLVKP